MLAEAFPERIAKARGKTGELLLASGRGAALDAADHLARESWLAVAELSAGGGGGEARDRVRLAAALGGPGIEADLGRLIDVEDGLVKEPACATHRRPGAG